MAAEGMAVESEISFELWVNGKCWSNHFNVKTKIAIMVNPSKRGV